MMTSWDFVRRSLHHYRRTNTAVVLGAAIATAALAGAFVVGHSVKSSLRRIATERLGAADYALVSDGFFRAQLADELHSWFRSAPMIAVSGSAALEGPGTRASAIAVYGVDERFFAFNGVKAQGLSARGALLSPALARELSAKAGDTVAVRLEEPSNVPREFLQGRRDVTLRSLRFRVEPGVSPAGAAEFSLAPRQGDVRAVFVPLDRLGKELNRPGRANTILLAGNAPRETIQRKLNETFQLEDIGLRLRDLGGERGLSLESESTLLDNHVADIAMEASRSFRTLARPFFTYLANDIRAGNRSIPYSLVAGADLPTLSEINGDRSLLETKLPPVLLNSWAAQELSANLGDEVTLEYLVWSPTGELATQRASFQLAGIAAMDGLAADRDVTPPYPGITDQLSLSSWDPPFPVDLKKVRPRDELYWKLHRTTPKAWIPLERAQKLWGSRYGSLTSVRYSHPPEDLGRSLRNSIDPFGTRFRLMAVREDALAASAGSTDFGQYFLYFSFFVIAAALLLMSLFFRLSVEQRRREMGLLTALGFQGSALRNMFLCEGLMLAALGAAAGVGLAVLFAAGILYGFRTWWIGATGTRGLILDVSPEWLAAGAGIGFVAAVVTVALTLRGYRDLSATAMLRSASPQPGRRASRWIASVLGLGGLALLALSKSGLVPAVGAFFGAGTIFLISLILAMRGWLRAPAHRNLRPSGFRGQLELAARSASWKPGRSILVVTLVAMASFLLISLEAFRHAKGPEQNGRQSGLGGFTIYAESEGPVLFDPNTEQGREALNLQNLAALRWTSFRLREGEDISCLNLYAPRNPRILGAPQRLIDEGRFAFADSVAASPETKANPWRLLETQLEQGVIPAIVDQNSMQYILHKRLGDELTVEREGAAPVRIRLVAALSGSLFQSELIVSEKDFIRLFPRVEGASVFLVEGPDAAVSEIESAMSDHGLDAMPARDRLARFHQVENTYISTFQALGALGLLIGTAGLAAVLIRNTLERRKELALLHALGFTPALVSRLLFIEHLMLLAAGLLAGCICALLAISPAILAQRSVLPVAPMLGLMGLVFLCGTLATWAAVRYAMREPLLESLRSE